MGQTSICEIDNPAIYKYLKKWPHEISGAGGGHFFLEVFYRVRVTLYGLSEISTIRSLKIFDRNVLLSVKASLTFYLMHEKFKSNV